MNHYDDDMLQSINANANLLDYVSNHMDLIQKGRDWFGHCPKHVDKTPSFSITPAKNSYYCFSCGCSGGIIGYLMDIEGLSFDEAVTKASRIANIDLSKACQSETIAFLKKLRGLAFSKPTDFQHKILQRSVLEQYKRETVKEWLDEGILQSVMDLFEVRVDSIQNRIVYPVYDIASNLINIKGRTRYPNYKELNLAKYINYYKVGVMDYFQGLNITLPYIKQQNEIIIFESVKSVMKAYGWGYQNCVSAEKHTLTDEQLRLLINLKVNIVFAFDTDVDMYSAEVKKSIDKLKRITNVFIINDYNKLLGGKQSKNAPVDCGKDIWEYLYNHKRKVT